MSSYGDARLELWEELCTCGASRNSPDLRMCCCSAVIEAGLDCNGCGRGVMLLKSSGFSSGSRPFWGCSMHKKLNCKFTLKFGPPHDGKATARLSEIRGAKKRERDPEERVLQEIVDRHEIEWRDFCTCGGAKNLNTFQCFMKSQGGCGFLPICPGCSTKGLFLKGGPHGRYWQCESYGADRGCRFQCSYQDHNTPSPKRQKTMIPGRKKFEAVLPARKKPPAEALTVEQQAKIEANKRVALEKKFAAKLSGKTPLSSTLESIAPQRVALEKKQACMPSRQSPATVMPGTKNPTQVISNPYATKNKSRDDGTVTLTSEQKLMIEANRKAALAKLHGSFEEEHDLATPKKTPSTAAISRTPATATTTTTTTTVAMTPSTLTSTAGSSTVTLSPQQKSMIEAKRQAALARLRGSRQKKAGITSPGSYEIRRGCACPQNETLYRAFQELEEIYKTDKNSIAQITYHRVAEAIRTLNIEITADNALGLGKGKYKVAAIGMASAQKMHEFLTTGKISKLEDKRASSQFY